MDTSIMRYCLSLLLLTAIATSSESNETVTNESREPRVSGRIVKLYSGTKPEPYLCNGEGFQLDPTNCAAFYRCVLERTGKFTVFRYQCAPGTVYDPDLETCNHPRSTRRTECGGTQKTTVIPHHTTNYNEIDGAQSELPRPISTKLPIYAESTTPHNPTTLSWFLSTDRQDIPTSSTTTFSINPITANLPISTTNKQWMFSTQPQSSLPPKTTQSSTSKNSDPCTSDGFMGDSENCRKFYRCVSNLRGGYVKYEFSCSELTVWDDEIQGCNHPWAVKRSKCGRSLSYDDKSDSLETVSTEKSPVKDTTVNNGGYGNKSNKTIQQQLQISHGSAISQTQVQISHNAEVIQNQTQINYGDKLQNNDKSNSKQNQTQISYGTAVSQTQTQIDYGSKGIQTQLQIDHSKDSSQYQVQVQDSTTQSTTSTTKNNSNGRNDCSESGFMGDSNDCKKFYRCVNNGRGSYTKYEYTCGDGTVWDPEIEACNHAWAVKTCGGKGSTEPTESHSTMKTTDYTTEKVKTTTSYITSQVPDIDDEDDVGYGNQNNQEITQSHKTTVQTTTTTEKPTSKKPNEATTQCSTSGFMGDVNDCKVFYRCVDNGNGGFIKYEFKCGDGTVWDSDIEACNHAWAVKQCGGSTGNVHKEESTTKKDLSSTTSDNTYTTVTLVQVTTQAPTQNDEDDSGYGPTNQEIQENSKTTTSTASYPQETNQSSECKTNGFMGDSNDCKKFYRCVDNGSGGFTRYEFSCGQGTVWDPKIDACNHAWAVQKCGGSHENEITSQTSSTTSTTTTTDPTNVPTTENSKETEKPATTVSTTSSSTTFSSSNNKCLSSGFMGDSYDCNKFYRCVDNGDGSFTRYEFTCGDGTVWDPKIDACNHGWAVEKCGGSKDSETTHSNQHTTTPSPVMQDEDQGNGSTTAGYETSESSQSSSTTSLTSTTAGDTGYCSNTGFMGDKNNCKKFYRCVDNGKGGYDRYEFQCGEGTVWDGSIEACNHAWAVKDCGGNAASAEHPQTESTVPTTSSPNEQSESQTQEPTDKTTIAEGTGSSSQVTKKPQSSAGTCNSEGFYANPADCKKFYRCVANGNGGYTKYDFNCGDGTIWNQEIQACDHESADKSCSPSSLNQTQTTSSQSESTTGSDSTTTTHETTTKSQAPENSSSQCTSEGFFAHPNNCKKFVRCVNNGNGGYTRYDFSCGDGTVWVQEIQACDHDNDIHSCNSQVSTTSQPQNTENNAGSSTSNSMPSSESTPPNRENDEYDNEPLHDENKNENDDCTSEGYFANKQDCRKFYRCVDNGKGGFTKYDFVCGDGTAWDSDLQTCNHISEVQSCSGSTQEENGNQQTTTNNNQGETESTSSTTKATTSSESSGPNTNRQDTCESEGYFGDSKDCKKFYRCVDNGKGGYTKYDFTCGDGTIWDQDITTCNHPQDVSNPSCNSTQGSSDSSSSTTSSTSSSTQTTSSSTTESSSQSTSDCSQDSSKKPANGNITCDKEGYYANPNDCKKFYRCVDWDGDGKRFSVFHFECGEGTIWDPSLDTCNHEESVYPPRDCSQSQSQNVGGESTTEKSTTTTTEGTSTTTEENTTTTTEESTTTTRQPTTSEQTTQEPTTSESTTQHTTTEQTTTEQSTTSEKTTTQESSTSEQTTTQQTTTQESTTTEQTTTSEQTTTQQPTTSEQTTIQQSTTSEQTTTQESTTSEHTTTQQSTSEQSTTEESTTSESTTQESTTKEQSTTQQSTTQESTTSEQTTTQQFTTSGESTTEESNESTTEQATTTTEQSTDETTTTEQSTEGTTTNEQITEGTTESTTTTEQNNDGTTTTDQTTTEETTEQSTTQTSSTESDSTESSTTEGSQSEKECPETDDDQYLLVCPTSFRRHPKYCNMFYQCAEDEETYEAKMAMFKCPNNTIYDENQTQCVTEDKAEKKCDGEIASKRRFKRLGSYYKDPIVADRGKQSCSTTGYFSFEKQSECAKGFLKCERNKKGELNGLVYQCPNGFIYWSISKRCERIESVRDCKRSSNDWTDRWNIPVERNNIARS